MPAALMFQLPRPEGLPDVETSRTKMILKLGVLPGLSALSTEEKDALFTSLSRTLSRSLYHQCRFNQVIQALNQRREQTGGCFITYDLFAQYTLFEAAAALGAIRLGIDEVIFITARLCGVSPEGIREKWTAEAIVRANLNKRPEFNIPEVLALRKRVDWYDELNQYRNVLYHRGWRTLHGGYFPLGSELPEATNPKHNIMLVPDRVSLRLNSRPHEWTYRVGERLEDVITRAIEGFEQLLDDVCMACWGGTIPSEGTFPEDKYPNMIVSLIRPALLKFGEDLLLPVFTSSAAASEFKGFPSDANLYLTELTPSSLVVGEPAFSLGLPGLKTSPELPSGDFILVIDPTTLDMATMNMVVKGCQRMPLNQFLEADETDPLSIRQSAVGVERMYVWREALPDAPPR